MKYEQAKALGEAVLEKLSPFITKGEIAGSVRRHKEECHDVDLVVIPDRSQFAVLNSIKGVLRQFGKFDKQGEDIIIVKDEEKGTQVDCYIANDKTFEMVLLIRTGSAKHNVKLAQMAIQKGLSLKHGSGLVDKETGRIVANTEKDIFDALGLPFVEPEQRD